MGQSAATAPTRHLPPPPNGTYAISADDLPHPKPVNMAKALLCTELSFFAYRQENRAQSNLQNNQKEAQRVAALAQNLGYQSQVFTTKNQQAVIYYNPHEVVVAFEGSRLSDLSHYLRNIRTSYKNDAPKGFKGKLHSGFDEALNAQIVPAQQHTNATSPASPPTLYNALKTALERIHQQHPNAPLTLTGHSAGGALAAITAARLYKDMPTMPCNSIYSFGSPRFANRAFKESFQPLLGQTMYRFEMFGDPIPALPAFHHKKSVHCGQWIPIEKHGRILALESQQPLEETFALASPSNAQTISQHTETLSKLLPKKQKKPKEAKGLLLNVAKKAAPEPTPKPQPHELNQAIDSLASAWNLIRAQDYSKHRLRTYAHTLHRYLEQHPQAVPHNHLDTAEQGLNLWRMAELYERMQPLAALIPPQQRDNFWQLRQQLDATLQQCEGLHQSPEKLLHQPAFASTTPSIVEKETMLGQKRIPSHRVQANRISRSRLLENNYTTLTNLFERYAQQLEQVPKPATREDETLIESSKQMLSASLSSLKQAQQQAPAIYVRPPSPSLPR